MKTRPLFSFFIILGMSFYTATIVAAPADLDTSFGVDGSITRSHSGSYSALAIQNDGKIIATGSNWSGQTAIISRYTSEGLRDTSFSTNGTDVINALYGRDLVIQSDGKILVLAQSASENGNIYVTRYDNEGNIDTSFGLNGEINYDLWMDFSRDLVTESFDEPQAIALQADGKIIIAGQFTLDNLDRRSFMVRLNSDGSVDNTFGPTSEGYRIEDTCTPWTYVTDLALAPNGDIVKAGYCTEFISGSPFHQSYLEIIDYNGINNTHFITDDSSGAFGNTDRFESVLIQHDGKILASGSATGDFLVARYNYINLADIELDSSFNSNGFTKINRSSNDRGWDLSIQPDSKILFVGGGNSANTTVIRFNTDGSTDNTFGSSGVVEFSNELITTILSQADGKIILGGTISAGYTTLNRLEGSVLNTQPSVFLFTDEIDTPKNSLMTSNIVTIQGLGTDGVRVPISISNGEYALNGSTTYSTGLSFVGQDDTVNVRHASSSEDVTMVNTVLTVGGILPANSAFPVGLTRSDTFSSTTLSSDTTPDSFNFSDQSNVAVSSIITSNSITVNDINVTTAISISAGTFSINGEAFTSISSTVNEGDSIVVQHTSAATEGTLTQTSLTIGTISALFGTTTLISVPTDSTPDSFSFTDQTAVAVTSDITSNTITVSGINVPTAISITGGMFSINNGDFTTVSTTLNEGDTVKVKHTSSANEGTLTQTTLTIGGVSDLFKSTTLTTVKQAATTSSGGGGSINMLFLFFISLLKLLGFKSLKRNIHH